MQVDNCPYYAAAKCRSCALLGIAQEERDERRMRMLRELVEPLADSKCDISNIVKPANASQSRGKVKLSVTGSIRHPILGLLDNSLEGIELLDCPLHMKPLNRVVHELKSLITEFRLTPYDISSREGELKGVILIGNEDASSVILRFVLKSERLVARIEKALPLIRKRLGQVKVVSANIQPVPHAILEGDQEILLTEQKSIWIRYGDRAVAAGPKSFTQVTPEIAGKLYRRVGELFEGWRPQGFLDLYCGSGAFSFFAAPYSPWGHGVETSTNAVSCAGKGAVNNNFDHLTFAVEDVGAYLAAYSGSQPEAVIVNPPRRGMGSEVVESLTRLAPEYLVYSSCNAQTQMRDIGALAGAYEVTSLTPFEMFPMTDHLEVLAVLQRRS